MQKKNPNCWDPRSCQDETLPCSPHPERIFLGIMPQKLLGLGIWWAMTLSHSFLLKAWPRTLVYKWRGWILVCDISAPHPTSPVRFEIPRVGGY